MKILFVCENYLPHYGGVEVVFKNLAEGYAKKGHDVSLITHLLRGTKRREIINGVKVRRVPSLHSRYMFSFLSIPSVVREARRKDVIHTTTFNGAFPAWVAGKICRKPVVITVHEIWIGKWRQVTGFPWWKSFLHDFLERLIYLLPFDKYICVSQATQKDLLRQGIKLSKIKVIYNGMDYSFWNPSNFGQNIAQEKREALGLQRKFVIFSWGRPGASKGFVYLVKALPRIVKVVKNAHLLLMFGSVDKYQKEYRAIRKQISRLKLDNYVSIIKSQPYEDLGYLLTMADCVVIPSLAEGFGYNVVEAASLGIPIVASKAGSIPEVVSGKYNLFEPKKHRELAESVISVFQGNWQNSKLKKFQWKDAIQSYQEIYECMNRNPQQLKVFSANKKNACTTGK